MTPLFLVTILSCSDIVLIANRLVNVRLLTPEQKIEILRELKKVVPSCPVKVVKNE